MPICLKCKAEFKNRVKIDGNWKVLSNRKFCLECSPYGLHNTRDLRIERCKYVNIPGTKEYNKEKYQANKEKLNKDTVERQRKKKIEIKTKLVNMLGGKCSECGYNKCHAALEFHHNNPEEKLFNLSKNVFVSKTWEALELESKKCRLLCANCHREEHYS